MSEAISKTFDQLDKIFIRDLSLRCIIGIFPEEREKKQDVLINVVMGADLRKAGQTDDINDTVDYKRITKAILAAIEPSSYGLIEKMAQVVADICFTDPLVQAVEVTIDKPGALRFAKASAVSIYRERQE
jgi:D-erythro-7,8-dihydroneopterin triphosphate epimerase